MIPVTELDDTAQAANSGGESRSSAGEVVSRHPVVVPANVKRARAIAEYLLAVPAVSVLVDGYNYAFRLWPESKQDIGAARRRLERQMHELADRDSIDVTVVWDGIQEPDAVPRRRRSYRADEGGASVVFSSIGFTADDTIVLWCKNLQPTRPIVVVTADRELAQRVGRVGANVITPRSLAVLLPDPQGGDAGALRELADKRASLEGMLASANPAAALWRAVRNGTMAGMLPDVLHLENVPDSSCQHGHMLEHTIAVVECAPLVFTVRLAALLQDIGMPSVRKSGNGEEIFHHHEVVGSRRAEKLLGRLQFSWRTVHDVSDLARMSGRLDGYSRWSDSAVRRYVAEIGPLREQLHHLIRSDRAARGERTAHNPLEIDDIERRIDEIAVSDAHAVERPQIDGNVIMTGTVHRPMELADPTSAERCGGSQT